MKYNVPVLDTQSSCDENIDTDDESLKHTDDDSLKHPDENLDHHQASDDDSSIIAISKILQKRKNTNKANHSTNLIDMGDSHEVGYDNLQGIFYIKQQLSKILPPLTYKLLNRHNQQLTAKRGTKVAESFFANFETNEATEATVAALESEDKVCPKTMENLIKEITSELLDKKLIAINNHNKNNNNNNNDNNNNNNNLLT